MSATPVMGVKPMQQAAPRDRPDGQISPEFMSRREEETARLRGLTGWDWDVRELAHVAARPLSLSPLHQEWRKQIVSDAISGELRCLSHLYGQDPVRVRAQLDQTVIRVREIARILAEIYRSPDLGNKPDPVDELIYIVLSRKTREGAYQAAYERLRDRYASWEELLEARPEEVLELVASSGLGMTKVRSVFGILSALRDRFGACTLEPARDWSDDELERFLRSLPDVERKSAYCVMLFAFGRAVFPADTHVGRILRRVDPFRELGVDLDTRDHRRLQEVLRWLVPPQLRRSMHVNLVMHGREVCTARAPRCDVCELARFCEKRRDKVVAEARRERTTTFMNVFCGAGGMSLGLARAGMRPLLALDSDEMACRTYRLNHLDIAEEDVICTDIRELDISELERRIPPEGLDVLAGAPPCQGFSSAGFRSKRALMARRELAGWDAGNDERNYLFEYLIEIVARIRPRVVLMENVPGMDRARGEKPSFMRVARDMLESLGYATATWHLDAASYGVPQTRLRSFLVASQAEVPPAMPEPDHEGSVRDMIHADQLPPITFGQAVADLPPIGVDDGHAVAPARFEVGIDDPSLRYFIRHPRWQIRGEERLIFNHRSRYNNERDIELYGLLRPGENSLEFMKRLGRTDLMRYRLDVFHDKYARLRDDRQSRTIVSHLGRDGNGYVHPHQVRSITPREGGRLQSFPDWYVFTGSLTDQWRQIGNAVPPLLAREIGDSINEHLMRFFRK